jgi:hypothetical protein
VPPLPRAPRPQHTSIDGQIRRTVLVKAEHANVSAAAVLELYREEECYPDVCTLIEQIAGRYGLDVDALVERYSRGQIAAWSAQAFASADDTQRGARRRILISQLERKSPASLLYMLPDPEFLTAIETAAAEIVSTTDFDDQVERINDWLAYTDKVLRKNGLPYRLQPDTMTFEWLGDPATRELALEPALLALADTRVAEARAEFEEALRRRRGGTPKDLQHAILEATKAVETVLKVLLRERGVKPPDRQQLAAMFNRLASEGVLPGYADHLIQAPGGPRNQVAHGEGASTPELADASVAAAATAITFLAHYLP